VHHINHIKDDDRPENLLLLSKAEHTGMHSKTRVVHQAARDKIRAWHVANAHRIIRDKKGRIIGLGKA
jgi:hypothetical protein